MSYPMDVVRRALPITYFGGRARKYLAAISSGVKGVKLVGASNVTVLSGMLIVSPAKAA